jgi:hypothetical protein
VIWQPRRSVGADRLADIVQWEIAKFPYLLVDLIETAGDRSH